MTDALHIIPRSGSVSAIPKRVVGMIRHCYGLMLQDVLPAYYAFKLEGVSVAMQKLDGSVRALVSGGGPYWSVLLDSGLQTPISRIALSDTSGDPVVAVNATALATKCAISMPSWRDVQDGNVLPHLNSREFLLWALENKHFGLVSLSTFTLSPINHTFKSNGVASDFLHAFPNALMLPSYYAKENGEWYCYASFKGSTPQDRLSNIATTGINALYYSNGVVFDIDDPNGVYVATREYAPWVVFKYKVFEGFGVQYGNRDGTIITDPNNPVYSFQMFGSTINIPLPILGALTAGKQVGITITDFVDEDSGTIVGACEWRVSVSSATILRDGTLSATIQPTIAVYRGDAWSGGNVIPVYGGVPYSFGKFVDIRPFVHPTAPRRVFSNPDGTKITANVTEANRSSVVGKIIEAGISGDMWSGIYATFVQITSLPGFMLHSEDFRAGIKYSKAGLEALTASANGSYVGSLGAFSHSYSYANTVYDMDGNPHLAGGPSVVKTYSPYSRTAEAAFVELNFGLQTTATFNINLAYGGGYTSDIPWPRSLELFSVDMGITTIDGLDGDHKFYFQGTLLEDTAGIDDVFSFVSAFSASAGGDLPFYQPQSSATFSRLVSAYAQHMYTSGYPLSAYGAIPVGATVAQVLITLPQRTYTVGQIHDRYSPGFKNSSSTGHISSYGFMFWRNAAGSSHGVVAQEIYCGINTKNTLTKYHQDFASFGTFGGFRAAVTSMIADIATYGAVEPSFLAAVNALNSYVTAISGEPTGDQRTTARALHLAALRSSYRVIVNNFASQTLLDFGVPGATLIVAPYDKPTTYA